jgi:endoglucanase
MTKVYSDLDGKDFLEKMLNTPSPSSYEDKVRLLWYDEMKNYADEVIIDVHGNAIASVNKDKSPRIMLAGHMDELGFQVKYIDDKGFIYFNRMGGFDIGIIPGRKVRIHTKNGDVLGVIGKKAIHLMEREEREKVPKPHQLFIDIGAADKKEAEEIVEIGDPVTYDPNFEELRNGVVTSRGFDDKIGAFVVAQVLKNVAKRKSECKAGVFSVATVQEEVGLRGAITSAYGINPDIGIAVDVTHASDTPEMKLAQTGEVKLGKGAAISRGPNINPKVFDMLIKIAKEKKINYQVEAAPYPTGTDANVIQITRAGVAAGLVSIPCRYMHTYTEIISLKDVEKVINLLTEFCLAIDKQVDFRPLKSY